MSLIHIYIYLSRQLKICKTTIWIAINLVCNGNHTIEDTDSVNNAISVSDGSISDKEEKTKQKPGYELAMEPWPVASKCDI